jgi:hypothetical protein
VKKGNPLKCAWSATDHLIGKKWEKVWDEVKYCSENAKGLIWFRNDLRVHDNESLFNAVENNESDRYIVLIQDILQNQDLVLKNRKIQS